MSGFDGIREILNSYNGDSLFLGLFLVMTLAAFVLAGDRDRKYLGVCLGFIVLVFTPVFYVLIGSMGGEEVYYRFLWTFPVPLVLAAGMVWLLYKAKTAAGKIITVVCLLGLLIIFGNTYITDENLKLPENAYGIPDSTIEIAEMIREDKEESYVVAAVDYTTYLTLRQYDPTIIYGLSRTTYLNGYVDQSDWDELELKEMEEQIVMRMVNKGEQFDHGVSRKCIQDLEIDYLTVLASVADDAYMNAFGCYRIGETEDCVVYKNEL